MIARGSRASILFLAALATTNTARATDVYYAGVTDGAWQWSYSWDGGVVPNNGTPAGTTYAVRLRNRSFTYAVFFQDYADSSPTAVDSISIEGPTATLDLIAGHLSVVNELRVNAGTFNQTGGTFRGAITGTGGQVILGSNIDAVTLRRNATISTVGNGNVYVTNGLTLTDNAVFGLDPATGTGGGALHFNGTQALGGQGTINASVIAESGTLTVGEGITITSGVGQLSNNGAQLINYGHILFNGTDRRTSVGGTGFTNHGTIELGANAQAVLSLPMHATDGLIKLDAGAELTVVDDGDNGQYRFADIGAISADPTARLSLGENLMNVGGTIATSPSTVMNIDLGGYVTGGRISAEAGGTIRTVGENTHLINTKIAGPLSVVNTWVGFGGSAAPSFEGATTLDGGTVKLIGDATTPASIRINADGSIGGTGTIDLAAVNGAAITGTSRFTLGLGVTILASGPAGSITSLLADPSSVQVAGALNVVGSLSLNNVTATGAAHVGAAGILNLSNANLASTTVQADAGGRTRLLDVTPAQLPQFNGGVVEIAGAFKLGGGSFNLASIGVPVSLSTGSGTLSNGTLVLGQPLSITAGGVRSAASNFDAMHLVGDLTLPTGTSTIFTNGLNMEGALTVNGLAYFRNAQTVHASSPIKLNGGRIRVDVSSGDVITFDAGTNVDVQGAGSSMDDTARGQMKFLGSMDVHGAGTAFTLTTTSGFAGSMIVRDQARAVLAGPSFGINLTGSVRASGKSLVISPSTSSAPFGGTGVIDLGDAALWAQSSNTTVPTTIRQLLKQGLGDGTWNGTGGIRLRGTDVPAQADALGFISSFAYGTSHPGASFAGLPLTSAGYIVLPTIFGDANLDQQVNFSDLVLLAANYKKSNQIWSGGDFNYDGTVNFADLVTLAQHYNHGLNGSSANESALTASLPADFAADWALAQSLVPEPASLLALSLVATPLRRRARR